MITKWDLIEGRSRSIMTGAMLVAERKKEKKKRREREGESA